MNSHRLKLILNRFGYYYSVLCYFWWFFVMVRYSGEFRTFNAPFSIHLISPIGNLFKISFHLWLHSSLLTNLTNQLNPSVHFANSVILSKEGSFKLIESKRVKGMWRRHPVAKPMVVSELEAFKKEKTFPQFAE